MNTYTITKRSPWYTTLALCATVCAIALAGAGIVRAQDAASGDSTTTVETPADVPTNDVADEGTLDGALILTEETTEPSTTTDGTAEEPVSVDEAVIEAVPPPTEPEVVPAAALQAIIATPELTTDKDDYHPGETATIFGRFFAPLTDFVLKVFGSDEHDQNYTEQVATVTTDDQGGFNFDYVLDLLYRPFYEVVVSTLEGSKVAETWFRDSSIGTYDQCSNDDGDGYTTGDQGCRWINGSIQANNSIYFEGDSTVQRFWLKGLAPGQVHTVTFKYGTTKGAKHAYDFLTKWDQSEDWIVEADLCQNIDDCVGTTPVIAAVPGDSNVPDVIENAYGAREFEVRGASAASVISGPTLVSGVYGSGDSETAVTLQFTVAATSSDMCISSNGPKNTTIVSCGIAVFFGAHVAQGVDWLSVDNQPGATGIPGAPYHVSLDALDGASVGERDNQMQSATVIPPAATGVITIIKDTVPDDAQDFAFSVTGATTSNFSLDDDTNGTLSNTKTISGLADGTYSVTETPFAGFDLTNINCTDLTGGTVTNVGTGNASIDLSGGETVTCTYTNTKRGHIVIVKDAVPNDAQNFTFTNNFGNGNPAAFDLDDDADGTLANSRNSEVTPGAYSVSESAVASWSSDGGVCDQGETPASLDVLPGETVTCTFTNTKDATLTLLKTVENDNGGTAVDTDWTLEADGPTDISGVEGAGAVTNAVVTPGAYTLSETGGPAGYTPSLYSCVKNGGAPVVSNALTLVAGDNAICTITNTDNAPSLTLVKVVENDNGGTATPANFTLTATGATGFSGAGPSVSNGASFDAGAYNLSEAGPAGYTASDWVCVGGTQNDADTVTLGLGQSATCTITNRDDAPSLTLVKEVVNDDGGDAVLTDWTLTATGPTPINGAGGVVSGASFDAGSYDLSESLGPAGYTAGAWNCTGTGTQNGANITLALGQSATCTIINDDQPGKLKVTKVTDPASDVTTQFDITASADGAGAVQGSALQTIVGGQTVEYTVDQGTYDVAEADETGWVETANTCNDVVVPNGGEGSCTITNVKLATVTIVKDVIGNPDPTDFTFNNNFGGAHPASFQLDEDTNGDLPSSRAFAVMPGTYNVSEVVPANWQQESATCTDGSPVGAIAVAAGENVTCTFVNEELIAITLVKNTVGGNGDFDFTFTGAGLPANDQLTTVGGTKSETYTGLDQDDTFSIAETVPAGWDLDSSTCTGGNTPAAINPDPGEDVTCTFTNIKRGHIIVDKVTDPVGDPQSFDFTTNAGSNFALTEADAPHDSGAVIPGTYSVSETVPAGWDQTSATCDDGSPVGAISLQAGETVTCTFTNQKDANIVVVKQTLPDGDQQAFDFTASFDNDGFALSDGQSNDSGDLDPGAYTVAETGEAGWDLTNTSCVSSNQDEETAGAISLQAGETVTCTFTNTKRGHIVVDKVTYPAASEQLFTFTSSYGSPFDLADATTPNDSGAIVPGTYSVDEALPTGWAKTAATCSDGSPITAIVLGAGETVTCTFTNVAPDATITLSPLTATNEVNDVHVVMATVRVDSGSGFVDAPDNTLVTFTLDTNTANANFVGGNTCLTTAGTCSVSINTATAGLVTLHAETDVTPLGISLHRETDGQDGNSVDAAKTYVDARISIGDDGTNSITDPHTFTVFVEEHDGTGWSAASSETVDFTLLNNTANAFFVGDVDDCVTGIDGKCTVMINANTVGTVNVHAESAVGVGGLTVTRETDGIEDNSDDGLKTYVAGKIIVKKETVGGDGDFDFTANYDADGFILSDGEQNDSGDLAFGTYAVAETGETGWDLTSATCDNGDSPASITIDAAETVTCTFTNTARGKIIVEKVVEGDQTQSFTFTTDYDQDGFSLTGGQSNDSGFIVAGEYTVSETVPAGWDQTSAVCSDQSDPDEIDLAAGETVTCTFTNVQRGHLIVEKTTLPAGDTTSFAITASGSGTITGGGAGSITDATDKNYEVTPGTYSVAETVPTGWDKTGDNCQGVVVAAGETKTCTITNTKRATVTIVKDAQPQDVQDFTFTSTVLGNFTLDDDTGVPDPAADEALNEWSNSKTVQNVVPGSIAVAETQPNQYWKLKGASCVETGTENVVASTLTGTELSFTAAPGAEITCTFVNEKLAPTRTQGFWQTHTAYTSSVFTSLTNPMKIGINATKIDSVAKLFGAWYSSIPKKTTGTQRTALDKARMQLLQQLVTAKLNCAKFGCTDAVKAMIATADTAYQSGTAAQILTSAGLLDAYNNSGDTIIVGNTGKATPKTSQSIADKPFWNVLP